MGQRWRENRGRGGEVGYLDPHANPPERHSQHSSQQSASGQRLPPTPADLRKTEEGGDHGGWRRAFHPPVGSVHTAPAREAAEKDDLVAWREGGGGRRRRRRREKRAHESSGTEVRHHASWSQPRKSARTHPPQTHRVRLRVPPSSGQQAQPNSEGSAHPQEAGAHRSQTRSRKRETPSLRANGARRKQGE